jgi:hypothetical protein
VIGHTNRGGDGPLPAGRGMCPDITRQPLVNSLDSTAPKPGSLAKLAAYSLEPVALGAAAEAVLAPALAR